ncbi:MAG: flavin reductase family protein [Bacteroidetes bacterium]|nr:flavin reductase family protein [Bacteroidota bacterium]
MKKPWNRSSQPVYSVSSYHAGDANMHICTYVTAVSMQPKRFIIALYKGTRTLELVRREQRFVLQLLAAGQHRLIPLLGRKSGHQTDKIALLGRRGLLTTWEGVNVLSEALAWMDLHVIGTMDGGDHIVYLCDVLRYRNVSPGTPLTLDILREKGLIRS